MKPSPPFPLSLASSTSFSHLVSISALSQFVPRRKIASPSLSDISGSLKSPLIVSKGLPPLTETRYCVLSSRSHGFSGVHKSRLNVLHAANMAEGQSDGPEKLNLDRSMEVLRGFWERMPQPVKSFPWMRALESFIQILLQLVYAVVKYLCVPLLAVSSLSEMSYCAQERKMIFIPIFLLAGFSVAGVLKDTAMELSPDKEDFPWHLLSIAIFFALLKLPGPYYPYWARIFVPHFANGGLWSTLWFALSWYRNPREPSTAALETPTDEVHSEKKP